MDLDDVLDSLERRTGLGVRARAARPVGGGSINRVYRVQGAHGALLLKVSGREHLPMFEAEADGLEALRGAGEILVPALVDAAAAGRHAYLALEWLELGAKSSRAEQRLGRALARLHGRVGETFGWHRHNTIGSMHQPNTPCADWARFFGEHRLGFQLQEAARRGLPRASLALGRELAERLPVFFRSHRPRPSLLHGDLWGGNWGATAAGEPCIFDPAVYFGDREADLAMTRLFGGFGNAFYAAYDREWPLPDGWRTRIELYNLYHLLNHFNLFGAAYGAAVGAALERLVHAARAQA